MNITQLCTTWGKLLMAFIEHKIYSEHLVRWQTREKTFALSKSFSSLVFRDLGLSAMPELICKKVCHCWEISTLLLITVGQTKTRCYHLILMTIKTFLMRLFKPHFGYHLMFDLIISKYFWRFSLRFQVVVHHLANFMWKGWVSSRLSKGEYSDVIVYAGEQ